MSQQNKNLLPNAQALRRNMTKEERHLWYDFLRGYPCHIYKQRIIGNYIVDFYCPSAKLIIELDGSQHYEDTGIKRDSTRSAYLEGLGLKIIRIPNNEVMRNFRGVCEYIDLQIKTSQSPSGDSSLRRAGVVTPYEKESLHKVEIESASQSPSGDSSLRRAGVVTPIEKESL